MPLALLSLLLSACATTPAVPPPCSVLPASAGATQVARSTSAGSPDAAVVTKWSHDFLDAFDRGDTSAVAAATSPGLVHFEGGTPSGRDQELAQLAKRKPDQPTIGKRSWSDESVAVRARDAVFVGKASEHTAGNDSHGGYDFVGWYTLVWSQEGDAWRVSFWGWQKGGKASQRDMWSEIFRNGTGFSKEPNQLLKDTIRGRKPGAALDLAMGQGRNALYLSSQGWKVTGVDFSDEGVRAAREAATKQHLALDAVNADLDTYDFGVAKWDLVTMIYALDKVAWIEKAKPSLKHGGLFVLEFFRKGDGDDSGFATGQLAALFKDGFEILRDEVVETHPDWAADHATLVRFVARKR
jgi:SAM-dependent methyltransferase